VTTGKGVTIHTIDCDTLESFADEPERWLDVAWSSEEADAAHTGRHQRHDRQRAGQSRQLDDPRSGSRAAISAI